MSVHPNDGVNPNGSAGASDTSAGIRIDQPAATLQPETPKPLTPEERARREQTRKAAIIAAIVGVWAYRRWVR